MQNLALLGLAVGQHHICVNRSVGLTRRVEDLRRGEDCIQAEGTRLIGNDRNEVLADVLVLDEVLDQAHQSHGGGNFELAGSLGKGLEGLRGKLRKLRLVIAALGNPTAQLLTQFLHVQQSRVICRRHVVRRHVGIAFQLFIGDGKLQTIAQKLRVFHGELLHLVRRVTTSEVATQRIALNSVSQDNGRLTGVFGCSLVCGVHLSVVVAAALQRPNLIVGPVLNHCLGPRIATKEVLTNVCAIICAEGLVVAIQSFVHQVNKRVILIRGQELVPTATPDDLDNVPTRTLKEGFEFLDDLAIAANRAIKALQVTVHDESQVIQALLRGKLKHATRFGLVHFTIAQEGPCALQ